MGRVALGVNWGWEVAAVAAVRLREAAFEAVAGRAPAIKMAGVEAVDVEVRVVASSF